MNENIKPPRVKICGLTRLDDMRHANDLRVDLCGFVFFKPSPRNLSDEQAAGLAGLCAPFIERVALVVDPDDDEPQQVESRAKGSWEELSTGPSRLKVAL